MIREALTYSEPQDTVPEGIIYRHAVDPESVSIGIFPDSKRRAIVARGPGEEGKFSFAFYHNLRTTDLETALRLVERYTEDDGIPYVLGPGMVEKMDTPLFDHYDMGLWEVVEPGELIVPLVQKPRVRSYKPRQRFR